MFKEEFILKKTPYRKKQIIAISLLFISGISLIFLESGTVLTTHESIRKILVNAFEGGFVGGLCDWFAVWKTYNAIENDSIKRIFIKNCFLIFTIFFNKSLILKEKNAR